MPNTLTDLIRQLESPDPAQVDRACARLGRLACKAAAPALFDLLCSDREAHWISAATVLARLGSRRTLSPLCALLLGEGHPKQREAAAYALAFTSAAGAESMLNATFIDALRRSHDAPAVRAQVAEGLANLHEFGTPSAALFQQAERALLAVLDDPAAEVRFWAAFALGNMRSTAALPALRALAADTTFVRGWWTVGEEAADAIAVIRGGERLDRIPNRS